MRLPSDPSSEASLIGAILLSPSDVDKVVSLDESLFHDNKNRAAFAKIKENYEKGFPVHHEFDTASLSNYTSQSTTDIEGVISVLSEASNSRKLITLCQTAMSKVATGESYAAVSEYMMRSISSAQPTSTISRIHDSLYEVVKKVEDLMNGEIQLGLTTGLDFEKHTNGFEDGKLYIVAARPAMGKSAFALEAVRRVSAHGVPVGVLSLEMSHTSLSMRLLTADTNIDAGDLRRGQISDEQYKAVIDSANRLAQLPIIFDDNSYVTAATLRARATQMRREHGIGMLVIDYLQLMTGKGENREQDVSEISRTCKTVAKDLGIPVIALAQLNRAVEARDNKRPRLSDLRESGSIEQDADTVMFLYRPEYYGIERYGDDEDASIRGMSTKNICEVIISKNRDGETGFVQQVFIPELMQFKNLAAKTRHSDIDFIF